MHIIMIGFLSDMGMPSLMNQNYQENTTAVSSSAKYQIPDAYKGKNPRARRWN